MKQILFYLLFMSSFYAKAQQTQQIVLTNGTDTVRVSMIPEIVGQFTSFDMCFDLVYQHNTNGYILEEWTDYWVNGYVAYFYIREGFGYEWVHENIQYSEEFQYTLLSTENFLYSSK